MQQAFMQKAALASTSIATNIAEGKGSYSKKTYLLYLEDARRSVYATVSFLEFIARKNWITSDQHEVLKEEGFVLVKMLSAFMKAIKTGNSSKTEAEEAPVPN
jgi:four helix bundle protein